MDLVTPPEGVQRAYTVAKGPTAARERDPKSAPRYRVGRASTRRRARIPGLGRLKNVTIKLGG